MKHKERVVIDATADAVWEYVGSPEVWPLFHAKAGECHHVSGKPDTLGACYDMEFRLGSRVSMTHCEIVEYRIGRLISMTSTLPTPDGKRRTVSACITYELEDLGRQTRVREVVEIDNSAVPWWLRVILRLLMPLGKPTGETTLQKLKRIVEETENTPP